MPLRAGPSSRGRASCLSSCDRPASSCPVVVVVVFMSRCGDVGPHGPKDRSPKYPAFLALLEPGCGFASRDVHSRCALPGMDLNRSLLAHACGIMPVSLAPTSLDSGPWTRPLPASRAEGGMRGVGGGRPGHSSLLPGPGPWFPGLPERPPPPYLHMLRLSI